MTKQEMLAMLFDYTLDAMASHLANAAEGSIADYWQHRANGVAIAFLRDFNDMCADVRPGEVTKPTVQNAPNRT